MSRTVFLSCVSDEFGTLRPRLARMVHRRQLQVRHQDDFANRGVPTLHKLEEEVQAADFVFHLLGQQSGKKPPAAQVADFRKRHAEFTARFPDLAAASGEITYTQWEAWFALLFGKRLCVWKAASAGPTLEAEQAAHEQRLRQYKVYPDAVADVPALLEEIRVTLIDLHLLSATPSRPKPIALPYPSLGTLFKGRDDFLADLRVRLARAVDGRATAVVGKALHGLGGVGKTRLAVEYAWLHEPDYTALLFVAAETPQDLHRNLAALAGPLVLDLPEHALPEEEARLAAALRWLREHPGEFLILDNVDTPQAAVAAEDMLARLHGGQVLITRRLTQWSGCVEPLELDVLQPEDAAAFLLERTEGALLSDHRTSPSGWPRPMDPVCVYVRARNAIHELNLAQGFGE